MSDRIYRGLMRLLVPAQVRHRHGADMSELFAARLGEAAGSPARRARVWMRAVWDLARHGTAQRLEPSQPLPGQRPRAWRRWPAALLRDARFAARMLRANPLFTAVAVATLALGIGANTAMFSVIDAVLLRPLPYPEPDRLVVFKGLDTASGQLSSVTTPANFADWSARARSFEHLATVGLDIAVLTDSVESRRLIGVRSAGSLHGVLGIEPLLGRPLTPEDDLSGERVVVLSHPLWQSLFGGEREALGAALLLDDRPHTVIGVMPPGFEEDPFAGRSVDFWSTSGWSPEYRASITNHAHQVIGRLRAGVGLAQAQEEMEAIAAQLRQERPVANRNNGVRLVGAHEDLVADSAAALRLLMGAVGFVLLIAAVNVANLLLARATAREQEIAIRKALGATRGRLALQVLVESLLLGLAGGAAGLLVAYGSLGLIRDFVVWDVPNLAGVAIDGKVLGFTLAAALLTGLAFGVLPALGLAAGDVAGRLRSRRKETGGAPAAWSTLVVLEVALAVVLLVGAGLLLRTFLNLAAVDPGFRTQGLTTFSVAMPPDQDLDRRLAAWEELERELAALPGVGGVARASQLPAEGNRMSGWFNFIDRPVDNTDRSFLVPYRLVGSTYFELMQIPLRQGRSFTATGEDPGRTEVVINESARRRFWGEDDPLGDRIGIGSRTELFLPPATVVGVVADVRNDGIGSAPAPAVYFPARDARGWGNLSYVLEVDPGADIMPAARERLRRIEPGATLYAVATIDQMMAQQLAPARSVLWLVGAFALLGLVMAAIGVFGLLSFSVSRRMVEIGIRIALGASGRSVVSLVVGQALVRVGLGAALGVLGALAASRLVQNLLYGISGTDPLTIIGVCVVLLLIALVASYLPARRAARADATAALRAG